MKRFWTSFWADDPRSIGGDPGRTFFCTGTRAKSKKRPTYAMCVLVEAESEEEVWAAIRSPQFYPEAEERFTEPTADDFNPNSGGRFPDIHLWQVANPQAQGPALS